MFPAMQTMLVLTGILFMAGFSWRLMVLGDQYDISVSSAPLIREKEPCSPKKETISPFPAASSAPETMVREEVRLFHALLENGLVTPEGYLLRLPEHTLLEERHRRRFFPDQATADEGWEKQEKLWQQLERDNGREIQSAIRQWNAAHLLAAVRDNLEERGGEGEAWRLSQRLDNGVEIPLTDFSRDDFMVPLSLGYIDQMQPETAFKEWTSVSPQGKSVIFRRRLAWPGGPGLTVQLFGNPLHGQEGIRITPIPQQHLPRCPAYQEACTADNAPGHILHFTLPPGAHELVIEVAPLLTREAHVDGVPIEVTTTKKETPTSKDFIWTVKGQKPQGMRSTGETHIMVLTQDDQVLTDHQGNATLQARALGLWPLLGIGAKDPYTLSGLLANSTLPPGRHEVHLTIDAALQKVVQETLEKQMAEWQAQGEKQGKEWQEREARLAPHRRAAVIMLDAESGGILAVAGLPQPPQPTRAWDVLAMGRVDFARTPMKVHAWQGADQDYTPASSFKPAVAVAAMRQATPGGALAQFLNGLPKSHFLNSSLFNNRDGYYYPLDFHGKIQCLQSPPRTKRSDPWNNKKSPDPIGVTEALAYSGNAWFVHLAFLLDGQATIDYDQGKCPSATRSAVPPRLKLAEIEEELGFGGQRVANPAVMDLAPTVPFKLRRTEACNGAAGDVLQGYTGHSDLLDTDGEEKAWTVITLEQNAFGHAMQTSPLNMARFFAALATGHLPVPHLIKKWNGASLDPTPLPFDLPMSWRKKLHDGLNAVVTKGTAMTAFKDKEGFTEQERSRVFGKTGTATRQIESKSRAIRLGINTEDTFNTAWFNGWYEAPDKRTVAFSCMVTKTHGPGEMAYGGKVCAPIMARILKRMAKVSPTSSPRGDETPPD